MTAEEALNLTSLEGRAERWEMVREAEAYNHRKAVEEAVARDEVDKENAPGDAEATPARKQLAHTLWVDKYRPSRFIELMSNGKVNRNVLLWLTQWKNFAEGKGPVEKKRPPAQKKVKFDSQSQPEKDGGGGGGGFRKPWEADVLEELDEDGRPGACVPPVAERRPQGDGHCAVRRHRAPGAVELERNQ